MAVLSAFVIWEIESGGSDTTNSGGFDPSQTAGMFADGAVSSAGTAAPIFSSVSYNFVAGDVNAWVYIASGTSSIPGWYKITSLSGNNAVLNATAGQATLKPAVGFGPVPSTATGCGTASSLSSLTWTIDYSQQTGPKFTYTDLSSTGVGLTVSSSAHPFGKQYVGNSLIVTGGTNFLTGVYVVASISGTTATVAGPTNIHNNAGTNSDGTGSMGGAFASVGKAASVAVASNSYMIKSATYTITSATQNIAAGCFKPIAGALTNETWCEGYQTVRGDRGTRPTLILNAGVSTSKIVDLSNNDVKIVNLILDGNLQTSSQGVLGNATGRCYAEVIKIQNCTNNGVSAQGGIWIKCETTGCTTQVAFSNITPNSTNQSLVYACESHGNTVGGFVLNNAEANNCISYSNSGASSDGFYATTSKYTVVNCVAYGNGRDGFRNVQGSMAWINCIAEGNAGVGFGSDNTAGNNPALINCSGFNNTGGNFTAANYGNGMTFSFQALTASPFVNAAGGNFALNNVQGGGASVRAASYPPTFPAGTTANFLDQGAVQSQDQTGITTFGVRARRG
jgi:hypothetical protein